MEGKLRVLVFTNVLTSYIIVLRIPRAIQNTIIITFVEPPVVFLESGFPMSSRKEVKSKRLDIAAFEGTWKYN